MTETSRSDRLLARALRGLAEGAGYGGAIGLVRGIMHSFGGRAPWFIQIGASLLAGVIIGAVVCCIGRSISRHLWGAWIGAVVGALAGLFLPDTIGLHRWITIDQSDGQSTMLAIPSGLMIGSLIGAIIGAFAERVVRRAGFTARTSA